MEARIALKTRPLMPNFGAEILDVDVTRDDPETLAEVVAIFHRSGAIVLHGQSLDRPQQLAFTRLFGEPAENFRTDFNDPDFPLVYVISNKVVNGKAIGEYDAGIGWHTDMAPYERPALCTMLHSVEVPAEGGDTLIADMCAAWNALPEERQQQLDGRRVHYSVQGALRNRGMKPTAEHMKVPDAFHPLVRRHASDGRKSLWPSFNIEGIVGTPKEEGLALMRDLLDFATQDRFVYRHKWQVGDILVWDDRCTLHTGTDFDRSKHIRLVYRTWVRGEIPL